jgi:hypothetical protein
MMFNVDTRDVHSNASVAVEVLLRLFPIVVCRGGIQPKDIPHCQLRHFRLGLTHHPKNLIITIQSIVNQNMM